MDEENFPRGRVKTSQEVGEKTPEVKKPLGRTPKEKPLFGVR